MILWQCQLTLSGRKSSEDRMCTDIDVTSARTQQGRYFEGGVMPKMAICEVGNVVQSRVHGGGGMLGKTRGKGWDGPVLGTDSPVAQEPRHNIWVPSCGGRLEAFSRARLPKGIA